MDLKELQEHIDKRFDKVEAKLDDYSSRISKTEEALTWTKGFVKLQATLFVSCIGLVLGALLAKLR